MENLQVIANNEQQNHIAKLKRLAKESNTFIIVAPFLSNDISKLFDGMESIKNVTIYTNMKAYEDVPEKIISLYQFHQYCIEKKMDLQIKSDDSLHGKVYLFYKDAVEKGMIITSGNFTENGLRNNHEFGVLIQDANEQRNIAKEVEKLKTYDISEEQLKVLYEKATLFLEEHKNHKKRDKFDIGQYIDEMPSNAKYMNRNYYLKPLGTKDNPFLEPNTLQEKDLIGFGKKEKNIHKGDVFLCHATGPGMIVGYYVVDCDEQYYKKINPDDRWGYKFDVVGRSVPFSKHWWDAELVTKKLVEEYLQDNPKKHITFSDGDTIGSLNFGSEKIRLQPDFARFIIGKIKEKNQ